LGDLMEGRGQRVNKQHTDGVLQTLSLQ